MVQEEHLAALQGERLAVLQEQRLAALEGRYIYNTAVLAEAPGLSPT